MAKMRVETYGLGGYDPKAKDGNLVSVEEVDVPDLDPDPQVVALKRAKQLLEGATTLEEVKAAVGAAIDGVAPEKAGAIDAVAAMDVAVIDGKGG